MPKGDERRVQDAFERWLATEGWHVVTDKAWNNYVDVDARHPDGRRLLAEVKGDLGADNGTNVDIGYGQILRRMTDDPSVQYALVIPEVATRAAQRVSTSVRTRLGIELYVVDSTGGVQKLC